jgi:hypothetical protein
MQVRVSDEDYETIKQLQKDWEAPNQQSVVNRLLESQGKLVELAKQLLEAKAQITPFPPEDYLFSGGLKSDRKYFSFGED